MSPRTLMLPVLLASLGAFSCGAGDDLLPPTEATGGTTVLGLLRERGPGDFIEFATERFEAVYQAETVRAPEWLASGGELSLNGDSVRWQLPPAGVHTLRLRLFLADGREVEASWRVPVRPREGGPAR